MDWDLGDITVYLDLDGVRKSANTYKIPESTADLIQTSTPVIVTKPRSGRHWLMLALECYFRESISYDDSPWSDNALPEKVVFVHQDQPTYTCNDYICVYRRDITSCVFSHMWKRQVFAHYEEKHRVADALEERASLPFLNNHLDWAVHWFRTYHPDLNARNVCDVITFEEMCQDLPSVIERVCSFLNEEYREEDAQRVLRECTKEVCATCCEPSEINLTSRYKELKHEYRGEYSEHILSYMLSKEPRLVGIIDA